MLKQGSFATALSLFLMTAAGHLFAQSAAAVPGEYLVVIDPAKTNVSVAAATLRRNTGGQVDIVAPKTGILKVTAQAGANGSEERAFAALAANAPGVLSVEPNVQYQFNAEKPAAFAGVQALLATQELFASSPNDPLRGEQWYLGPIRAPEAWDVRTSSDIVVAVLDSGFHHNHKDLVYQWLVNEAEFPPDGIDSDANGFVDDISGWDFVNNDNSANCDRFDFQGQTVWEFHGTHVAGIIGARGNDGYGVTGMCWNVRMLPLKVGHGMTVNLDAAAAAMEYACDRGAKVINCSFSGSGGEAVMRAAVRNAATKGALVVAEAGDSSMDNDASPVFPAALEEPNLLTVAATDDVHQDRLTDFSNYGWGTVDLAAPGRNILSTMPDLANSDQRVDAWSKLEGTSMASPIAAGAAALVWMQNPSMTPLQVKKALKASVDEFMLLEGKCESGGRLNVQKAMQAAKTNHTPTATAMQYQSLECKGTQNIVTLVSTVNDYDGGTLSVEWRVSDVLKKSQPAISAGSVASFEYDFPHGTSVVELRVTDPDGAYAVRSTVVTVEDTISPKVVVAPTATLKVNRGELFASRGRIPRPSVTDVCDPSPTLTNDAAPRLPIGRHVVRWTATDNEGNKTLAKQTVKVVNTPPRANAGRDIVVSTAENAMSVRMNGAGSSDADGHELSYRWDGASLSFPTAISPLGRFPIGKTRVRLVVRDEAGATSVDYVNVTVRRRAARSENAALADQYAAAAYGHAYQSAAGRAYDPTAVASYGLTEKAYLLGAYAGDQDPSLRSLQAQFSQGAGEGFYASFLASGDPEALLAASYSYAAMASGQRETLK
ncbi:MAG TPA: S8 family serine peptidase [Pirellulaceae bacterium]|jgi:subtilisin family serine protease|nr:S8 family serine peptidase [Pirellulaceae bacterium]